MRVGRHRALERCVPEFFETHGGFAAPPIIKTSLSLPRPFVGNPHAHLLANGRNIVNIDFCAPVIEAMKKVHADKPGMEWKVRIFLAVSQQRSWCSLPNSPLSSIEILFLGAAVVLLLLQSWKSSCHLASQPSDPQHVLTHLNFFPFCLLSDMEKGHGCEGYGRV